MAKYIPGRNYIGSSEVATDLDVTGPATFADTVSLGDSDKLYFGDGNDFEIYHDGTDTLINNATGHVYFKNAADDKDIEFQCDNGSGGTTPYIRLDGSSERITVSKDMRLDDSVGLQLGAIADLSLAHDGTNSEIANNTGDLRIKNRADDKDIIFETDDGSGGIETYFFLDGSGNTGNIPRTVFPDNSNLVFGTGNDLFIRHNTANSEIKNFTGDLILQNNADDKDIIFQSDDGSGGVTTYMTVLGSNTDSQLNYVQFPDNIAATFGDGNDLRIYHYNGEEWFDNSTGDWNFRQIGVGNMIFQNLSDDKDIIFQSDDGSGGTTTYLTIDGSATNMKVYKDMRFSDNIDAEFGDNGDFKIYHDGSNTYLEQINAGTGNVVIQNSNDDADIIFKSDDGSGGVTAYLTLDGSDTSVVFNKSTKFGDGIGIFLGTGNDLSLSHNGTDSNIVNWTGHLYIDNNADNKDIILRCDDDSGGLEEYIKLDGSQHKIHISVPMLFGDNKKINFGDGSDFHILHDGTDSHITNKTSHLTIENEADDSDIIFKSDNGSGGTTEYFRLDGGIKRTIFTENIGLEDDTQILIGAGNDLQLYHNATDSYIINNTGDLYIKNLADDKDIIFQSDDGSGGYASYFRLDGSTVETRFHKATLHLDNVKAKYGDSGDLELYHDGTGSYIVNGLGDLEITNNANNSDIIFKSDDGAGNATKYFQLDGSVASHDGSATTALYTSWPDKSRVTLGTSRDMQLYHDGTSSYIQNQTGSLTFKNFADDTDIIFQNDDGSGGVTTYLTLDGGATKTLFYKNTEHQDSIKGQFGDSGDFSLFHNGTDSYIENDTGDLYIRNNVDDKDIIFQCDDGSGGVTAYITLDGSAGYTTVQKHMVFADSASVYLGTGADLQLVHDGSNSTIQNNVGNLTIRQDADDGDIVFKCDDGSGGVETYFYLDGSGGGAAPFTVWPDSSVISFGDGHDLRIEHTGSYSRIRNYTGNLNIDNYGDDTDIIFQNDDGSGGITEYFRLDGSSVLTYFSKHIQLADSQNAYFGGGGDMSIKHDGSNSHISNYTGNLNISNNTDDSDIIFNCDDGSGGTTEYFRVDGSSVQTIVTKNFRYLDNAQAMFGTGEDLAIYHDATDSYVNNATGDLYIKNTANDKDIIFQSDDGSGGVQTYFKLDGSVNSTMFPDSSKLYFGSGHDAYIEHDGTNTYLSNATGKLMIRNTLDDGDIELICDDGSGGNTAYITLDGSAGLTTVQKNIKFEDSVHARFGNGSDLRIFHDGSNSEMNNHTGHLSFINYADDKDIIFKTDDGSGGTTAYMTIDGGDTDIKVHKNFEIEKTLTMQHTADPSDPATGHSVMWSDTSGNLKVKINVGGSVVTRTLATGTD